MKPNMNRIRIFALTTCLCIVTAGSAFAQDDTTTSTASGNTNTNTSGAITSTGGAVTTTGGAVTGGTAAGGTATGGSATGGTGGAATGGVGGAATGGTGGLGGAATGGNITSSGGTNTNAGVNGSSTVTVNTTNEAQRRAPVTTAYATQLTATEDTCMGSTSAGAQGVGFGLSVGSTWTDKECIRRKNAREMHNMGYNLAGVALMCQNADVASAMATAGTPCPGNRTTAIVPVVAVVVAPHNFSEFAPKAPATIAVAPVIVVAPIVAPVATPKHNYSEHAIKHHTHVAPVVKAKKHHRICTCTVDYTYPTARR